MTEPDFLRRLRRAGVFGILRAEDPATVLRGGHVLAEAGVDMLEVTFTVPHATDVIAQLRAELPDHVVGAGTLRGPGDVERAAAAGAQFLVTPGLSPDLAAALLETGLPAIPGVFSPSEVMAALSTGFDVVKLFPAGVVGPAYLRQLLGPFPELLAVPTGGVRVDDVGAWLSTGAPAVGLSTALCSAEEMARGAWDDVRGRAERLVRQLATRA